MHKGTTRSHYVPQTYLKHFLLDGTLYMYKKGERFFKDGSTADSRIMEVSSEAALKNVGLQNNLYDPGVEGLTADDLEEIFGEYGEQFLNPLIAEIEVLPNHSPISPEIKTKLCTFMASMRVRTPHFKKEIEEMDGGMRKHMLSREFGTMTPEEMMEHCKEVLGYEVTIELATKLRDQFANKTYKLSYPNGLFIKAALSMLDMHVEIFEGMVLNIVRSTDRYFITSDNPLVHFVPQDKVNFYHNYKSLMSPHTEVFFPLTKNLGVTLNRKLKTETITPATREMVDVFNYNISINSRDFFFSPLKMNDLHKFVESYIPYPFKFSIS